MHDITAIIKNNKRTGTVINTCWVTPLQEQNIAGRLIQIANHPEMAQGNFTVLWDAAILLGKTNKLYETIYKIAENPTLAMKHTDVIRDAANHLKLNTKI